MSKIYKYIDLSGLPITGHGVDWPNTIGKKINFQYGENVGEIEILERIDKNKYKIKVVTKDMSVETIMKHEDILYCKFGRCFKKPVAFTHPELLEYFVDLDDAYNNTYGTNKKVPMKCPICGKIKSCSISNLTRFGFVCSYCSDGISYPEKFLKNIFDQLNVSYLYQVGKNDNGFEWIEGKYKYDFYININNQGFFIETDGEFHFVDKFESYESAHKKDLKKNMMAEGHGIDVIRINCNYDGVENRFDFIKANIINSKLSSLLDLNSINWEKANLNSLKNYVIEASNLWNRSNMTTTDIGKILKIHKGTVVKYLKIASSIGLCDYNHIEIQRRRNLKVEDKNENMCKPVMLLKDDEAVGVFKSGIELDKKSENLLGVRLNYRNISAVCHNKQKTIKGYNVKFISKEEYELLYKQFNNTKLLKGGMQF